MDGGLRVGATLDRRWVLRRVVARSDHATVYEATHAFLDRVASIVVGRPEDREKVLEEATARDRTYHPGILGVLDVCDTRDGLPYLAGAPFTGRSLDGLLMARGALPPEEAVLIALSLAEALIHVHALGMAHAALSPGSILVDGARVVILDLGIFPTPLSSLSGPLACVPYTAPERLTSGAPASRQTDVYTVAAILAEMLSGEPPEEWPPNEGSFPPALAAVVERGLDDAERRHPSMEAFAEAVRTATTDSLPPSEPPARLRRKSPRVAYVSAIRVRLGGDATLDGRTENICEGGLLVLGVGNVEVGASVLVRLALPASGRIVSEPATVRWVRGGEGQAKAFGVSFDDPAARTLDEIQRYVALVGGDEA
ncbi:MAG: PilZ domain-containing protein [Sandaracinaceae bacterium]|nr:PilZ domain-containing protein [Sandaracinaceae bacterium]